MYGSRKCHKIAFQRSDVISFTWPIGYCTVKKYCFEIIYVITGIPFYNIQSLLMDNFCIFVNIILENSIYFCVRQLEKLEMLHIHVVVGAFNFTYFSVFGACFISKRYILDAFEHLRLTRHWLGEKGRITPLPLANFLNNLKLSLGYRHETCGTSFSINLAYSHKISAKSVEKFLRKWRFSDVMSCDFGPKTADFQ